MRDQEKDKSGVFQIPSFHCILVTKVKHMHVYSLVVVLQVQNICLLT